MTASYPTPWHRAALLTAVLLATVGLAPKVAAQSCGDVNFDADADGHALAAGTIVDDEYAAFGITVTTGDPANHPAMVFDTANPTGGDGDLATPGFGPGNDTALGNVLIVSEDGDASDPDDDARGGTLIFLFDEEAEVASVGILDIDQGESAEVTAFDGGGAVIASAAADDLGNNSVQRLALGVDGVRRLEVTFSSSGAVTDLDLECDDSVCEDLSIDFTTLGSTVVPAEGGTLSFKASVTNHTDDVCTFQAWLIETRPDGSVANPAKGPITLTLQPHQMRMRRFRFRIGSAAQAGEYFCEGAIGLFPDILDRTGFVWTKLGDGSRLAAGSGDSGVELLFADTGEPVGASDWFAPSARTEAAPAEATALSSYPNPFHSTTTVEYAVAETDLVTLRVYDLTGRVVATLAEGAQAAGTHRVSFDGHGLAAGTYLYRLQVGSETQTHRVVLMK